MGFFDKMRYWRTATVLFPSGLILLFFGIKGVLKEVNIAEFVKYQGVIASYGQKDIFDSHYQTTFKEAFYLQLKTGKDSAEFFTPVIASIDTLKKYVQVNTQATIWTEPESNMLKQIEIAGNLILPLSKSKTWAIILLALGGILTVVSIVYVATQKDDLE